MKYTFLFIAFLCNPVLGLNCQEIKPVKGFYSYPVPEHISFTEARLIAIENAKYNALELEFGTDISDVSTYQNTSVNTEGEEVYKSYFTSYGQTRVKGEWLKTTKRPIVEKKWNEEKKEMILNVSIEGMARLYKESRPIFEYQILECEEKDKCRTDKFMNGQKVYLHFQSPVNGFLSVYWEVLNENSVYRILPTSAKYSHSIPIDADKPYLLFSDKSDVEKFEMQVGLKAENLSELNRIIFIFSKNELGKPITDNSYKTQKDKTIGPPVIELDTFNDWLFVNRSDNKNIQVKYDFVQILPSK